MDRPTFTGNWKLITDYCPPPTAHPPSLTKLELAAGGLPDLRPVFIFVEVADCATSNYSLLPGVMR
jgi:hypothetical protein